MSEDLADMEFSCEKYKYKTNNKNHPYITLNVPVCYSTEALKYA